MHVPYRMLYEQQEIYYGLYFNYCANERVGHLNPTLICQERHTFRVGKDNEELLSLEDEDWGNKIKKLRLEFESKYAFYIG